ncbi:MAG: class I SAM-dependent methyltransferase [Clostridia bacterium]|nr:class I SAM-dependent methyltransferase [Clostridia bacterium]
MNEFTALAQYYDRFVGADYPKIAEFIDVKIKALFPEASLVCDIGCGSGTLALSLLEKGYDMIGIDGSIDMLTEALDKRADLPNGDRALFLCQQLPEFELYGTVDVIVSTLDTLNYLTSKEDLDQLFYWFRNYLNPEGLLIFDVNTLYKYQELLDQHCEIFEDDDVFLAWRSQFDGTLCSHQLSFFSKENNCYARSDEEQLQRYYSQKDLLDLLAKYNFKLLGIFDDYSEKAPNEKSQRLTFVAKKED